jgi:hypothetical protein
VDKPLKDCGYDDAVTLVAHIEAEHHKKHGDPLARQRPVDLVELDACRSISSTASEEVKKNRRGAGGAIARPDRSIVARIVARA